MKGIRVAIRKAQPSGLMAASVMLLRGELWGIAGVFQLLPDEWALLMEFCASQEIEITNEKGATIPPKITPDPAIRE